MASDEQVERLARAIEMHTKVLAAAIGAVEAAIRETMGKTPPSSSRPSSGKTKVAR